MLATTSQAAAKSIAPHAATLRDRVHAFILAQGLRGATAHEIDEGTGLGGNTVRPRLIELRAQGRITTMGEMRETGSGRMALAWISAGAKG